MKRTIILCSFFFSISALADNNLLTQNLSNNLWNIALIQNPDTVSNIGLKETTPSPSKYILEGVGGILGELLGGFIGASVVIVGLSLTGGAHYNEVDLTNEVGFLLGAPLGAIIGVPTGVVIAGKKLGEKGSYWKTLFGTLAGAAIGYEFGCILYNDKKGLSAPISTCIGCVFPIFSTVLTYTIWK